ncbi:TrkH family potassium uptake protein [Candidatus Haliotispira prima]|uniref:TrkH family potassium uptake protein n=1 Tax=Candidatus Haliotispira prima TaxID=3034016 RepID=A0ABY8MN94_9SPIO|nr:TrkH family potassium uptake protein [Candidatus Haliotispira prima]
MKNLLLFLLNGNSCEPREVWLLMNFRTLFLGLSALMFIISLVMLVPLAVALIYGETHLLSAFLVPMSAGILLFGTVLWVLSRQRKLNKALVPRDALLLVSFSWFFVSALSALPFVLSGEIPGFVDAFFEIISGYTTTGASILNDIEKLSKGLLFWRAMTHWLGGMGFIVLTIALFPLLGIGGAQLMRAEAPGPNLDKVTYRINDTAKILWLIYTILTFVEIILLYLGGMDLFDSVAHSFATMATGGYSTKNLSIGAFRSPYIRWVITIFMILAGCNFMMFYHVFGRKFDKIRRNTELKVYLSIIVLCSLAIALVLKLQYQPDQTFAASLSDASFQVASILTTTGFASVDYGRWPESAKVLLFLLMFVGGSAGSTAGGVKVVRVICLFKKSLLELRHMLKPRDFFHVVVNGRSMNSLVLASIIGFLILYVILLLLTTMVLAFFGSDLLTSFTGALAVLGNIGPGFGSLGPSMNYGNLHPVVKVFLSVVMVIGRLEIYTVLVLFMPRFWRNF